MHLALIVLRIAAAFVGIFGLWLAFRGLDENYETGLKKLRNGLLLTAVSAAILGVLWAR
jgi:hypothetical protein